MAPESLETKLPDGNSDVSGSADTGSSSNIDNIVAEVKETFSSGGVDDSDFELFDIGTEKKLEVGEDFSITNKNSADLKYDFIKDKTKLAFENETKVKIGNAKNSLTLSDKYGLEISKDGVDFKNTTNATIQAGFVQFDNKNHTSVGFDGKTLTAGSGVDNSLRFGDDDKNLTFLGGKSEKAGLDGSYSKTDYHGASAKFGPVEGNIKQSTTNSVENKENKYNEKAKTETETHKTEVGGAVEVGSGVKIRGSVEIENSHSISESDKHIIEEKSQNVTGKVRIEVDSEKAGVVPAVMAATFNASMEATEKVMSEATKTTTQQEVQKEGSEQDQAAEEAKAAEKAEEEVQKEAEEQAKAEEKAQTEEEGKAEKAMEEEAAKSEKEQADQEAKAEKEQADKEAEAAKEAEASNDEYYDYGYGY